MPALLPVLPLAVAGAVIGDLAPVAGLVHDDAGDGVLCGAAVGAVLEGGRGGGAVLFLLLGVGRNCTGAARQHMITAVSFTPTSSAAASSCCSSSLIIISLRSQIRRHGLDVVAIGSV